MTAEDTATTITTLPEAAGGTQVGGAYEVIMVWLVPYAAYFVGIAIRRYVFPVPNGLDLGRLLALGIPVCLIIVSPIISGIRDSFSVNFPTYLFTVGIIMEHGLLVHETAINRLRRVLGSAPITTNGSRLSGKHRWH